MLEFNESLIAFDLQAKDAKEVIDLLAGKYARAGTGRRGLWRTDLGT